MLMTATGLPTSCFGVARIAEIAGLSKGINERSRAERLVQELIHSRWAKTSAEESCDFCNSGGSKQAPAAQSPPADQQDNRAIIISRMLKPRCPSRILWIKTASFSLAHASTDLLPSASSRGGPDLRASGGK